MQPTPSPNIIPPTQVSAHLDALRAGCSLFGGPGMRASAGGASASAAGGDTDIADALPPITRFWESEDAWRDLDAYQAAIQKEVRMFPTVQSFNLVQLPFLMLHAMILVLTS